ncbi:MAG: RHS repeat-associated core domain-containing protein, partial [Candidatus Hydrogenedentes bacterium]|nr:RHS repeat-associated core domain-containing protein [Candidatus Hydrogenedentota bacterium]
PHTRPRPNEGNVRGCTPKKPTNTYDQFGRMTRKTGGDTTKYRYGAGWDVLNEEDGSGTLQATYVHHPGKQIGTVLATSEGTSAATGTWNYPPTADLRHIPSKIRRRRTIGSTQSKIRRRRTCGIRTATASVNTNTPPSAANTPTTARTSPVEDPPQEEKFTGHAWDSEARLYYTAYRYYSPDANRWLTRDPLGMVDGPNVYAYVVNNPVSLVDIDGRLFSTLGSLGGLLGGIATRFAAASFYGKALYISAGVIAADVTLKAYLYYSSVLSTAGDGTCSFGLLGFLIGLGMWQPIALSADVLYTAQLLAAAPLSKSMRIGIAAAWAYQINHVWGIGEKLMGEIRDCQDYLVGLVDGITLGKATAPTSCDVV